MGSEEGYSCKVAADRRHLRIFLSGFGLRFLLNCDIFCSLSRCLSYPWWLTEVVKWGEEFLFPTFVPHFLRQNSICLRKVSAVLEELKWSVKCNEQTVQTTESHVFSTTSLLKFSTDWWKWTTEKHLSFYRINYRSFWSPFQIQTIVYGVIVYTFNLIIYMQPHLML